MNYRVKTVMIKNQQGFSMVEVLIALVILAIGLLGHMAMQMTSLSSNQSSYYRSQASITANEIADRMRINPVGVAGGLYDAVNTDTGTYTDPNCNTSGCSTSQQSALDLFDWQTSIRAAIPGGIGTVTRDASITTQSVFTVAITWSAQTRAGLPDAATVNRITMDIGI